MNIHPLFFKSLLSYIKYGLLIFIYFPYSTAFTQPTILSTTDFFINALKDPYLNLPQQTIDYLQNTNHELSILDKLEFRTETNDFAINKQEYILRFGFSTEKERAAQRRFHQSNIDFYTLEKQVFLEELLEERYKKLVDFYYQQRLITALEQQKLLYQDKLFVLRKSIESTDFDIDELIETEENVQELEHELLELQFKFNESQKQLQIYLPNISSFDVAEITWLNVADIQQRLQLLKTDTVFLRPLAQQQQVEIQQIEAEYAIEKAQSQNLINYAQIKYGGDSPFLQERFSIGVGILFPFKNNFLLDLNELELDRIKSENNLEIKNAETHQEIKRIRAKIDLLIQQYQLLELQIKDNQTAYTLEQYSKIEGISPLSLLKLKGLLMKKEWSMLKIEYELFQVYVEWLVLSGSMMQVPLKDYLSKNLNRI